MHAESDVNDLGADQGFFADFVATHDVVLLVLEPGVLAVAVRDQGRALLVDAIRDQWHVLEVAVVGARRHAHIGEPVGYVLCGLVVAPQPGHAALAGVVGEVGQVVLQSGAGNRVDGRVLVNENRRRRVLPAGSKQHGRQAQGSNSHWRVPYKWS